MNYEKAIFAGGCFWCMQPPFQKLDGVIAVTSGYTGGTKENPTYEEVSTGKTGHVEAVEIVYDPKKVSYDKLLEVFWEQIDPTDENGQFFDRGPQYVPAVFYLNDEQKQSAEKSKKALEDSKRFDKRLVIKILPASKFYEAEEYHQDFYKKSPARYNTYKAASGREQYLARIWKEKDSDSSGKK
ncbi:MAG: peptide-methionine (S)-S-oxide reductase [Candidatus Margulisiibacteriota bacterium]|nr:MAG: peptide-methionine (S)-S-oxide reductase [Candidatus Margulisbacteria bacterium GWD2_39_127]OGI05063.1 MAG: peptide-methionine (S)-S-oxide reductase [Candidatus Margulisbacteria bacterium GWF2_38_17]OGI10365.1 MAG: peptide-methionine (S)-S-oxide reductase [Candidatus Margulisbacteria bacterium GWE2_39_32]PZM83695.1 MAG: peptide-methionine (S)-S-oxide reductase [Candidatus Margulisiibacteriota bacterium]HAR64196.1 peptide-methionine (S)-S-oxide reductase [Candidatus Margulisiibacteriota 